MKKLLCIIVTAIFTMLSVLSSSAYHSDNSGTFFHTDYSGAYMVEYSGSRAVINRFADTNTSAEIKLDKTIHGVCVFGETVVFLSNDTANNQLAVYVYNLNRDCLDSFCIYGAAVFGNTEFCCDSGNLYIEDRNQPGIIKKYGFNGALVKSYSLNGDVTCAFSGYSRDVFFKCGTELYRISGDSFSLLTDNASYAPMSAANDGYLISESGEVYKAGNGADYLFTVDCDSGNACAAVIEYILYCSCGSKIYGYDIKTGDKTCSFTCDSAPITLFAENGKLLSVDPGGDSVLIDRGAFTDIRRNTANENSGNNDNNSKSAVSSTVYQVNQNDLKISGIPAGTTFAEFKRNMDYNGYTVILYRDGSAKKSGNIGTAMMAEFTGNNRTYTYELSVIGDLTGEGNMNSRDLILLMDYLIGYADFDGVYFMSADLSRDGMVDVKDLALMKRSL